MGSLPGQYGEPVPIPGRPGLDSFAVISRLRVGLVRNRRAGLMRVSYPDKIKEQVRPYLEADEHALAALMARPRGATVARAGGLGPAAIGGLATARQARGAEAAGLKLASPMGLVLTSRRLLVLRISSPIAMGKGGDVKEF